MNTLNALATWFLVFMTYSVIGWCMEVVRGLYKRKKITNRGFLIGPLCPIYGCGALVMTLLLNKHVDNLLEVFVVAVLVSAVLEYITSFLMEKLFRVRWWDYSQVRFNLNGRICLLNLFYFGIFGMLIVRFVNPVFFWFFGSMNSTLRLALAGVLLAAFIADICISLWLIINCRVAVGTVHADATDEITANIKNVLMGKGKLNRRLAKAFPNMEAKKKNPRKRKTTTKPE